MKPQPHNLEFALTVSLCVLAAVLSLASIADTILKHQEQPPQAQAPEEVHALPPLPYEQGRKFGAPLHLRLSPVASLEEMETSNLKR